MLLCLFLDPMRVVVRVAFWGSRASIQECLKHGLRHRPGGSITHLSLRENKVGRGGRYLEFMRERLTLVQIDGRKAYSPSIFVRELVEDWRHGIARLAPRTPKKYQHRLVRLQHLLLERLLVHGDDIRTCHFDLPLVLVDCDRSSICFFLDPTRDCGRMLTTPSTVGAGVARACTSTSHATMETRLFEPGLVLRIDQMIKRWTR